MVAEIWRLWLQSGRPDLDAAMQQATNLMNSGLSVLAMPTFDDIDVQLEWAWTANEVITLPVIADVDGDGVPDVVVNTTAVELKPRFLKRLARE